MGLILFLVVISWETPSFPAHGKRGELDADGRPGKPDHAMMAAARTTKVTRQNMAKTELPRGRAATILHEIREMLAQRRKPEEIEAYLEKRHGIEALKPCTGDAHSNPHIDHCMTCAPGWGWLGAQITIK